MQFYKRIGDSLNFLYKNPLVFALYLPIALLGLIQPAYDSTLIAVRTVLVMLILLLLSTFVFAFSIMGAYYYENKRTFNFNSLSKLALQKFTSLLIVEAILIIAVSVFSATMDSFSAVFTSDIGQAFTIVFFLAFFCLLIKFSLSVPSTVLKGKIGFKESWKLVGWKEFLDLALFVIVYSLVSYGLSLLPLASGVTTFLGSMILSPIVIVTLTMLYLDYLKR